MRSMKKVIALVLTAVLVMGLAACGNSGSGSKDTKPAETKTESKAAETTPAATDAADNAGTTAPAEETTGGDDGAAAGQIPLDGSWPEEKVKIGFVAFDTTADQYLACMDYFDYLSNYFNIEIMSSESLVDAEGELNFISDCAAAGCKAIIGYYNEAKAESAKAAMDLGMYYWGGFGGDEEAYNAVKDNELYLGGYTLGDAEYNAGRSMAEALIEQGCEKIALCSGGAAFGVPMFVDRTAGFNDAVKEAQDAGKNVEVVHTVEGWPGTDSFTADQAAVLDMDIDAIASTFDVAMWFQPLMNSPKAGSVKLAAIGEVGETYHDFFNDGVVTCIVYDCEEVVFGNAIPMILNSVNGDGDVVRNADGTAALFPVQRWTVTNSEEYNAIYDLHESGTYVVTGEDVAQLIKAYNPDTTAEKFFDYYGSLSVDSVK